MAFLDVFFPAKKTNMSLFDKYPSIEIQLDGTDIDTCHINVTEVIKEQGRYRFERIRTKIKKEKLEKILGEIINISMNK